MKPTNILSWAALFLGTILPASQAVAADAPAPAIPVAKPAAEAARFVEVSGAVKRPQQISFPKEGGLTWLEAVSKAQGHNRYANIRAVQITRIHANGQSVTFLVDAMLIVTGQARDLPLMSGDRIIVPERRA